MIARRIGRRCRVVAAVLGSVLFAAIAQRSAAELVEPPAVESDARAVEMFRGALALADRELPDLAVAEFAALVERYPNDPLAAQARHQRGVCLAKLGRYDEAIAELQAVLDQCQQIDAATLEATYAHLGLAQFHLAQQLDGDARDQTYDAALATFATQRAQYPDGELAPQAALTSAEIHYTRGQHDDAVRSYHSLAEQYPGNPLAAQASYLAAYAALESGDARAALLHAAAFEAKYSASEFAVDVRQVAAEAHLQLGEHEAAAAAYQRLLEAHAADEHSSSWLVRRALCLSLAKRYDDVIATLAAKWSTLPSPAARREAGLLLGAAYLENERAASAVEVLAAAASIDPPTPTDASLLAEVLLTLGRAQHATGNTAAAVAALSRLIDEHPASDLLERAYFDRAECRAALGDDRAAVDDFQQVCERWPDSRLVPHALLAQARAERRLDLLASAHGRLNQLLQSHAGHPLAPTAHFLRATVRHEQRLHRDALSDIAAFLETNPPRDQRSDALLLRGLCEVKLERPNDAVATFESILADDPGYAATDRVLYELAWAYGELGQPERVTATFLKLAQGHAESPLAAECWYRVGEAQHAAGEFAAAAESFEAAHRIADDVKLKEQAAHKLAWARFSLDQFAEAEQAFTDQLAEFSEGPLAADARLMLAETLFARQDYAAALDGYTAALDQRGVSRDLVGFALLHAGQAAAQLNRWDRSFELLDQCLRQFPDAAWANEARYERGWALYHQQQFDAAEHDFQYVADADSAVLGARARFMLGEIHFARKQYDAAVRTFFKVAYGYGDADAPEPFHPWQAEALFEAARCLELTERFESARRLYHELVTRFPDSEKAAHARVALREMTTR